MTKTADQSSVPHAGLGATAWTSITALSAEQADLLDGWAALNQAIEVTTRRCHDDLAELGLRPWFYPVLIALANQPDGKIAMQKLAGQVGVSSGEITRIIDLMADRDLVRREHSTIDRRLVLAVLTAEGRRGAAQAQACMQRSVNTYLQQVLGQSDLARLTQLLSLLREANRSTRPGKVSQKATKGGNRRPFAGS